MLNRDLRIGIPVNDQQGGVELPNNVGWCRITDSYAKEESGIELGHGDKGPFREAWQKEKLPGNESLQCGIGTIGHNGFHIRVPRQNERLMRSWKTPSPRFVPDSHRSGF